MERMPLISVVVPVYNVAPYVERCLNSITAQTYRNFEIIAVDDASTDDSGRVCDACAEKDGRIHVVRFPVNRGPSAARNEGIRRAKGTLITFVDSDDYVEPDLLEKLYDSMADSQADVSTCGADGIALKGGPAAVYSREEAVRCLARGTPFNLVPWGKLYTAELVRQCPFDEEIFYSEDLLFLYQILKRVRRVSYLPDRLYHYVQRAGSQVQSGVTERKCTAFFAQDTVCEDAARNFPEEEMDFHQLALEADRNLAMLAVKKGAEGGRLFDYLRRIRANIRRHFSWRALALCPRRRDAAAILMLYVSAAVFWWIAMAYTGVKRLGGR